MGFDGWKRAIFKWIEKKTCDNSTFVEVESHNIRDFSISEGLYTAEKSAVIWNGSACGVNQQKFDISNKALWRKEFRDSLGFGDDDIVFSFAARLTADKGINELLSAFMQLEKSYVNVKLIVMGGDDNANSLDKNVFAQAKLSKNIVFTGSVNNVEAYYAASDVFVSPSYREGFGLVAVEAQMMGLPAIVSNVPGQIDTIIDEMTGLLCNVKDTASLCSAMERLTSDTGLREKMGIEAARFAKENYDQRILFSKLKEHRDELVSR